MIKQKVLAKILTDGLKTTLSPEVSENSRTITVFTSTSSIPTIEFESKKEEIKSFLFFRDNNWLVVGIKAMYKHNGSEVFGKETHHKLNLAIPESLRTIRVLPIASGKIIHTIEFKGQKTSTTGY